MILTVTLNAAIDRTVAVPNFRLGHRHRAVESRTFAGGKGVNVARALKLLGRPVIATGLAGAATGSRILESLVEESILHDFTRIEGESRTNLAVIDPTSGEQTEINERGPEVRAEEVDWFIEKLLYLAQGASLCVLAGSLPPGVDPAIYARLIGELRQLGVSAILDTDGEPMRLGLRAEPAVVAPISSSPASPQRVVVGVFVQLMAHGLLRLDDVGRATAGPRQAKAHRLAVGVEDAEHAELTSSPIRRA